MIDSYLVTATSKGEVNWTEVETNLTKAVNSLVNAGLIKIPEGMTRSVNNDCYRHCPYHPFL